MSYEILVGKSKLKSINFNLAMANRHGLISGATGTGKTLTLQSLAQGFSDSGVPVFISDIKSDLSGLAADGNANNPKINERFKLLGMENMIFKKAPVCFWDIFGEKGLPVRATISDMGPLMLSHLMSLNETQESVMQIVFKMADEMNLHLLDLKDLESLLAYANEHAKELQAKYGLFSVASINAIRRGLLTLESEGAKYFFGEPMLNINDLIQVDKEGKGIINILSAEKLMSSPKLYATSLLWMLSELFENMPEVGDLEKPKFVFFFDEAHLLFNDTPKVLVEKIEQVVRLIRSKGVGIYFITQSPLDIPDRILAQLSHRFQHALRAFTPKDKKTVNSVAETMRDNPLFKAADIITELAVGEALVSTLNLDGTPSIVERVYMTPPTSKIGPIADEDRKFLINKSNLLEKYGASVDRNSAYEQLNELKNKTENIKKNEDQLVNAKPVRAESKRQTVAEAVLKTTARTVANEVGKQIVRGLLGGIFGRR